MAKKSPENTRKHTRLKLSLPTTVIGCGNDGEWRETVKNVDISVGGIAVILKTVVQIGEVVFIELPFPVKINGHPQAEQVSSVYAVVKRVTLGEDGRQMVGLEFMEMPTAASSDTLQ